MTGELGRLRGPAVQRKRDSQAWRTRAMALVVLAIFLALLAPLFLDRTAQDPPRAVKGQVSLAGVALDKAPARIAGEWKLTWASPKTGAGPAPGDVAFVKAPGFWKGSETTTGVPLPDMGRVRYDLEIAGLNPQRRYVLHLPTNCPATQVWVDGRLASQAGLVGPTADTTRTVWRPHDVAIAPAGPTVRLGIEVASFEHECNGIRAAPLLGEESALYRWRKAQIGQDFLFHATLLVLSLYSVVVFIFRPEDRASLYLSASLLFFLPASALLGLENLVTLFAPDISFPALLAIVYPTGIVAIALFLAYAHTLFPQESPRRLAMAQFAGYGIATAATFAMIATGHTRLASIVYPIIAIGFIATLLYIVGVLAFAVRRGRPGAWTFLIGISVFAGALAFGVASATGLLIDNPLAAAAVPVGILFLLFSQVLLLGERWANAIRSAETMNTDLRRLMDVSSAITSEMRIETLLAKIVAATSNFLHADRSSLFLFDARRNFLWSLVAQGLGRREIHLGADEGIAGLAFSTGATVNVQDAYKHPKFNREVDEATGYRTKNILAMPIAARDGRRLGVMQALNQLDGRSFDDGDIERMRAFASQAAIAIDNATLFSEVVEARNYNESILGSMSNGVITLDAEGRLMKMNAAACAIMEIEADRVVGRHFSEVLVGDNAWFVPEIGGVLADGRPRTFLDVNFRTGAGRIADMNVQIVPLRLEGANNGLLVLAEDISEEKRLEGAMRRFMTPQVVDQVLQDRDDILFGTSCRASVLFADIRNFTTMAEALTPRETVDMLNEIFAELVEAVSAHDGVLDKFMGDAVMAVYGAPLSSGRDTENAIDSAVAMMRAVQALNERRAARGASPLQLGIGIASGDVVAGTIGSPKRMDYTVIGDSVNLASRLQNTTKHYKAGIVVCEATSRAVADPDQLRQLDTIRVRGRARPERIYQVLTYHSDATFPNMVATLGAYRTGMACLGARNWAGAVEAFTEALRQCPDDRPSALQLERARHLAANPPPADWDGVWTTPDEA